MKHTEFEAIIIGGGMIGLTLACALASQGVRIALIEKQDMSSRQTAQPDGRASAISYGSKQIFEKFALWQNILPEVGVIEQIRVSDGNSNLFLHFDRHLLGTEPLGFMIENNTLINKLYEQTKTYPTLTIFSPCIYHKIENKENKVFITVNNQQLITAQLLIAADGKHSPLRKLANIKTNVKLYDQHAIVCNVSHDKNHDNIAQERFLPSGPFAILPLQGGYSSSIVWTERKELAPLLIRMSEDEFLYFLQQRFTDYLGNIKLCSKRFCHPLSVSYAEDYYLDNIVLIGDAAHSMHPIAGQGVNMGIRDIEVLVALIVKYKKLGCTINNIQLLKEYQNARQGDNLAMISITDSLNNLFSNNIFPITTMRRVGLAFINKIPPLQKFLMQYARGMY